MMDFVEQMFKKVVNDLGMKKYHGMAIKLILAKSLHEKLWEN